MSKQAVTNFRIFAKFVKAEVRKRGGHVKVPRSALQKLVWCGWDTEHEAQTIVFTLKASDKKRRDLESFVDQSAFRLDVVMKYLIITAPDQRLSFTDADLTDDADHLTLGLHLAGLFALVTNQTIPASSEDDRTITVSDTISVTKNPASTLVSPKN